MEHPVPTKRGTVSFVNDKSCNAFLRMLLVCICSYLKSVPRYEYLMLYTCYPDTLYLREQGLEDPWLFSTKPRRSGEQKEKKFGKLRDRVFVS
jgi:hypothetical protein